MTPAYHLGLAAGANLPPVLAAMLGTDAGAYGVAVAWLEAHRRAFGVEVPGSFEDWIEGARAGLRMAGEVACSST